MTHYDPDEPVTRGEIDGQVAALKRQIAELGRELDRVRRYCRKLAHYVDGGHPPHGYLPGRIEEDLDTEDAINAGRAP